MKIVADNKHTERGEYEIREKHTPKVQGMGDLFSEQLKVRPTRDSDGAEKAGPPKPENGLPQVPQRGYSKLQNTHRRPKKSQ